MYRNLLIFIIIIFIMGVLPTQAQCAMCRAVLESEDTGASAKGINNGIVYLMLFPYLLVGTVGYFIYKMKKGKKQTN